MTKISIVPYDILNDYYTLDLRSDLNSFAILINMFPFVVMFDMKDEYGVYL